MIKKTLIGVALATAMASSSASATPFTRTSPTSAGMVPAGVTEIGGVVIDLVGTNNNRVISQLAASSLYVGFSDDGTPVAFRGNPLTIGIQTGFTAGVIAALGGGLSEIGIRITLFDGDTGPGNFDENQNTLAIDGTTIGNWSDVVTQNTSSNGLTLFSQNNSGGFRNSILDTGWFHSNNAGALASIFADLADGELVVSLTDTDPTDNFYDFTQGVDGGLINVGQGPVVTPPGGSVPEPGALALFGLGLAGLGFLRRRTAK